MAESAISFLSSNLLQIFYVITGIIFIVSIFQFLKAYNIFSVWNPKLQSVNEQADSLDDEDISEFEEEASASPFMASIFGKIRDIARNTKNLSVNEVTEVLRDEIYAFEDFLISAANGAVITGVFFTVLGLFTGLVGLSEGFKAEAVGDLLGKLQVAFITTIFGVSLSVIIILFTRYTISPKRDTFMYNIVIFAKNVLAPKYSIPDAERDLGIVVRAISKSSSKLEQAAVSVHNMAENTRVGTEQIQNAVKGFLEVTDKMSQREDHIIMNLHNQSDRLVELKNSIENSLLPHVDELNQKLLERDLAITGNFELLKSVQKQQSDINLDMRDSLEKISSSMSSLSDTFNRDFEGAFRDAVDSINQRYKHRFDEIAENIDEINDNIRKAASANDLQDTFEIVKDQMNSINDLLSDKLSDFESALDFLRTGVNSLVNNIGESNTSFDRNIRSLAETLDSIQSSVNETRNNLDLITQELFELKKTDNLEFASLKDSMEDVFGKITKLESSKAAIIEKIDSLNISSQRVGGIFSNFKSLFSDEKKTK